MTDLKRRTVIAGLGALAVTPVFAPAIAQKRYDEGANDREIKIGNIMPYSGNASAYGNIGRTHEAVMKMVNDAGGLNGRKINFITYDDGYSPPKAVEMVRKLVEEDKVLFIFNPLGTPSNTAIQRYLNQRKVPQLFVATGASKWGQPRQFPWTMGWQPDYVTEGAIYAKHILATKPDAKIGVLMQNDDYGKDYFNGFKQGLGAANERKIVQLSTYEVTDPTVDSQMIQLKNSGADVFFNITTPKFAAQAIKKAAEIAWKPVHYLNNVSSSFGTVFGPAGIDNSQGILLALYRKDVNDPQWDAAPDVVAFKAFMAKYMPNANLKDDVHNYGYSCSHTLLQALRQAGDNLTRENVMKEAANLKNFEAPLLLPGIKVNTSPTDFYPIQSVQMARVKGNSFELFGGVLSNESTS
ncbi:MAG: ABC transporter substrate-binding protein [Phreatobacter sp.]|nr:ABC transporter substrate-binding protein [Phreatobacter sp.]